MFCYNHFQEFFIFKLYVLLKVGKVVPSLVLNYNFLLDISLLLSLKGNLCMTVIL